jgi:hypothetical protein
VEGWAPCETKEEIADAAGAGNVEALAPSTRETERERTLPDDNEPGLTEPCQGAARDERP